MTTFKQHLAEATGTSLASFKMIVRFVEAIEKANGNNATKTSMAIREAVLPADMVEKVKQANRFLINIKISDMNADFDDFVAYYIENDEFMPKTPITFQKVIEDIFNKFINQ
jgi:hypothetical protein